METGFESLSNNKDPYEDVSKQSDIEMDRLKNSYAENVNTITDIGVQTEIERIDQRIDSLQKKVYSRGICGPKRLGLIVFILFIIIVLNFLINFLDIHLDTALGEL